MVERLQSGNEGKIMTVQHIFVRIDNDNRAAAKSTAIISTIRCHDGALLKDLLIRDERSVYMILTVWSMPRLSQ